MISDKYSVLIGSLTYALKTFSEVIEHDLGNTIIGRQSVRSIIEVYIMMKYLALKEGENPQVWNHYKAYGVGKYKLVLLKIREGMGNGISHVSDKMLDLLVNEPQTEELTEVDLRYFDNEKIRDKAIAVGEKELYDIAYDYDSSFAHALWGAVRESSMLACDNIFHHFSPVPDATFSQNLSDVTADCFSISKKLIEFANAYFAFPEWYVSYLGELHV